MSNAPQDARCLEFAEYVLENYIEDGSPFPPLLWSDEPSGRRRTNNGCEAFHCHYNEQLYSPHPSIFNFTDVVKKFQGTTYITMRSLNVNAPLSKVEREKLQLLSEQFQKYQSLV
jgi:hypothetical protein